MKEFITDTDFRKFNIQTLGLSSQQYDEISVLTDEISQEDKDLLFECFNAWNSLTDFRKRRERSRNYLRGKQLLDKIPDPDCKGSMITEKEHIERQGMIAFKNNQIRQLVKNVIGQYRSNETKPMVVARHKDATKQSEMMSMAVRYVHQINMIDELDARNFEEFLISGCSCGKVNYRYWKTRNMYDCYTVNVGTNRLFFNTDVKDVRMNDLRLIGEIIDIPRDELVGLFAKTSKDKMRIEKWYPMSGNNVISIGNALSSDKEDSLNFLNSYSDDLCRFFEIWKLRGEWRLRVYDPLDGSYNTYKDVTMDMLAAANMQRLERGLSQGVARENIPLIEGEHVYEQFWYVKYLTPSGNVLFETETPFTHEEHPYSLLLYPLIDGEVWGFVEDIIDQQRHVNRMITLLDASIGMGMKNLLLVPEESIPDGMDIQDYADEWTKINGVIMYKSKGGIPMPKEISANSVNVGAHDLLALQIKMMQDISGVHGAAQGQAPTSNTPSSLYAQQAQNASLNLLDSFEVFNAYRQRRDTKLLKVIQQYYRERRYLAISGRQYQAEANVYDPDIVQNMEFDLIISQSLDTPAFRQMGEELLMKLFEAGAIPVELFLEHTSMPMGQNILQSLNTYKQQMQQGQAPEVNPEILQQINSNPQTMELLNQMVSE